MYLSKNSLRSLAGLQQFRAVRSLSLADNLLASWEALWPLVTLGGEEERRGELAQQQQLQAGGEAFAALEVLSLEGNPLAALPNYRSEEQRVVQSRGRCG